MGFGAVYVSHGATKGCWSQIFEDPRHKHKARPVLVALVGKLVGPSALRGLEEFLLRSGSAEQGALLCAVADGES